MLSVALMAHPSRSKFITALERKLAGVEVVLDQRNDRWDTGRRSLLAYDPAATHHLVVQDDAILCRDFLAGAELVAAAAGTERPVGLYIGKVRPHATTVTPAVQHALTVGAPWLEMEGPWWGVALIVPTQHIDELVAWGDQRPRIKNYDRRITAFYAAQGIDCWYTIPSLVDHRPVAENPSLIEGRTGNRQAHVFLGRRSPLKIDWSRPPVRLNAPARFRHRDTGRVRRTRVGSPKYRSMNANPAWIPLEEEADDSRAAA